MTEQEVQQIYDYLHENYRYEDGKLIRLFDAMKSRQKQGDILGSFFYHTKGRPFMVTSVTINGIKKRCRLDKLIYLFHFKKMPERMDFIDGNPMNLHIENLILMNQSGIQHAVRKNHCIKAYKHKNKDGTEGFSVQTKYNNKILRLGTYRTKKEATIVYQKAKKLILENKINSEEIIETIKKEHPGSSLHIKSKCGFPGVSPRGNKFACTIRLNGIRKYLGLFETAEQAGDAYLKAKEEYAQRA